MVFGTSTSQVGLLAWIQENTVIQALISADLKNLFLTERLNKESTILTAFLIVYGKMYL
jgi:hypothetical protein